MAEDSGILGLIVKIIIIVLTLIVIFLFIGYFLGWFDLGLIPDYFKKNQSEEWNKEYFLEHEELIVYYIDGKEAELYLKYDITPVFDKQGKETGVREWVWSKNGKNWFNVENSGYIYESKNNFWASQPLLRSLFGLSEYSNKQLDAKNQNFLKTLLGKSPEEGLKLITDRVRANEEGYYEVLGKDVKKSNAGLDITINKKVTKSYDHDNPLMGDVNDFIIKLNQLSRGAVK
ncbi:MAG: hypothetical protein RL557_181 [archaeon]|jgi:lipopolysaccharide export LptBFGC system permease protein LptF